jgi:hypothetical protein
LDRKIKRQLSSEQQDSLATSEFSSPVIGQKDKAAAEQRAARQLGKF